MYTRYHVMISLVYINSKTCMYTSRIDPLYTKQNIVNYSIYRVKRKDLYGIHWYIIVNSPVCITL